MDTTPVPARHLYTIPEAMRLLAISRAYLYQQIRAGRLRVVKLGRATRVPAQAITDYVQLLINESETLNDQAA